MQATGFAGGLDFLPTFSIKGGEKIAFLRGISVAVIPLREKMGNYDVF